MKKNDIAEIEITDMSATGSGIGRCEGMAVFVPLTVIGDKIRTRIVKLKKNYAFGIIEEILVPSADRIDTDCAVFKQCGGCSYRHINYEREKEIKYNRVKETMMRIGKTKLVPEPLIANDRCLRYRNKAQYPVMSDGRVGFYSTHSHRIIPCEDCLLQPKEFSVAAAAFREWITECRVSVYDENTNSGLIRHFYIRRGRVTGEIMAVAVINGNSVPYPEVLIEKLNLALGDNLKSVILNINTNDTNVILGDKNITLWGSSGITDILCGVKIHLSPLSFYQVNHDTAKLLYKKAAEYLEPDNKVILDLYCGAGTIGLSMAKRAKKIIGVEIVKQAVIDAQNNAKENNISNAEFICADAAQAAKELKERGLRPDAVIVDPPRKGCSEELIKVISEDFRPERVVYVSCDPATLARDTEIFSRFGYELISYTPVDMFPRTPHVECVCILEFK